MTKAADAVQKALDVLYGARPSEFVALRKKLAAETKSAGDRDAAEKIIAARRPTATAWAMNHVMRNNPDVVARFTAAVDALRGAQRKLLGVGSAVKTSGSSSRADLNEVTSELIALARAALETEDGAWNPATQRRIATSLRTFPMANAEDREKFLKGLLEKDLDTADDDTLLQTTFGLADDEMAELPHREHVHAPREKAGKKSPPAPVAHRPAPASKTHDTEHAERAEREQRARREKEAAEEAKRAAADLERRIRVRDRKADDLDKQAERLEARAQDAEASAARARALADSAKKDAQKARAAKP